MIKKAFFIIIYIIFSACSNNDNSDHYPISRSMDSINILLPLLNDTLIPNIQRDKYIEKLIIISQEINSDSLKNEAFFKISYELLNNQKFKQFYLLNQKSLKLSHKLNDTSKIAALNWDLASYHLKKNINDSAFFYYTVAEKLYNLNGMNFNSARVQLNMAILQKNVKDYTGSEINTFKAIRNFEKLKEYKYLYSSYNNLGIIYNELEEYEKSINYHKQALKFLEKMEGNNVYFPISINNIGVVYQNMGELELSREYFKKGLKTSNLKTTDPELYAMLLDNFAYSRFLGNKYTNVELDFREALTIRDRIKHDGGITINKIHFGEYYLAKKDTIRAYQFFDEAYTLSKETNNYRDMLRSLLLVSKIDKDNGNQLINDYIHINDSLLHHERTIRNKFARIKFETDEYISENIDLNSQKKWLIYIFITILIISFLIYTIRNQKLKNRELVLVKEQQVANEEIYNLLINSRNKLEEGKENEKKRISKELHDGILSEFFGVRLNLELLNDNLDIESIQKREKYIKELKQLENEIRTVSHQLNDDLFTNENSFITIIEELFNSQEDLGLFKCKLHSGINVVWDEISNKIKINIYRIIQEALHNINKYAEAKIVEITFAIENNNLKILVEDDGVGFDNKISTEGIGHKNMKSRIRDLGGEIVIESSNLGTNIIMYIPLQKD